MQVLNDDYNSHGFVTIAINLSEDMDSTVRRYARRFTYLFLRDPGSVWAVYKHNNAIPLNYIIDTAGVIRYWNEGFDETTLRRIIQQWLPDPITHDVGVKRIIAPSGALDSGTVVTPACSVFNAGANAETYPVRIRIGAEYDTVAMVTNHLPNTTRYVTLPDWTALGRGLEAITCTTELAGDGIPSNNVATSTVTVMVYDLSVTQILAPPDSVDSATVLVPSAEVRNPGTVAQMARVKFYIGNTYLDSVNLPMQPGKTDTANLRSWTALLLGTFPVRCSVSCTKDQNPDNNLLSGNVRVVHRLGIEELPANAAVFALFEPVPNPARELAGISYSLARPAAVDLRLYSAEGQLVRTLRSGIEPAGLHSIAWDGRDELGNMTGRGVYYCRLVTGDYSATRKLTRIQ
jgi:hypothetical protein